MKMKEGENMNYWDIIFIGIYLPLTVIIYNFIKQKNRWKVLLISSYIFFWSISGKLLIYLLMTTLLMHYFGLWITEIRNEMDDTLSEKEKKYNNDIIRENNLYDKKVKRLNKIIEELKDRIQNLYIDLSSNKKN